MPKINMGFFGFRKINEKRGAGAQLFSINEIERFACVLLESTGNLIMSEE